MLRERDRERDRESKRQRDRDREREGEGEGEIERERETDREIALYHADWVSVQPIRPHQCAEPGTFPALKLTDLYHAPSVST